MVNFLNRKKKAESERLLTPRKKKLFGNSFKTSSKHKITSPKDERSDDGGAKVLQKSSSIKVSPLRLFRRNDGYAEEEYETPPTTPEHTPNNTPDRTTTAMNNRERSEENYGVVVVTTKEAGGAPTRFDYDNESYNDNNDDLESHSDTVSDLSCTINSTVPADAPVKPSPSPSPDDKNSLVTERNSILTGSNDTLSNQQCQRSSTPATLETLVEDEEEGQETPEKQRGSKTGDKYPKSDDELENFIITSSEMCSSFDILNLMGFECASDPVEIKLEQKNSLLDSMSPSKGNVETPHGNHGPDAEDSGIFEEEGRDDHVGPTGSLPSTGWASTAGGSSDDNTSSPKEEKKADSTGSDEGSISFHVKQQVEHLQRQQQEKEQQTENERLRAASPSCYSCGSLGDVNSNEYGDDEEPSLIEEPSIMEETTKSLAETEDETLHHENHDEDCGVEDDTGVDDSSNRHENSNVEETSNTKSSDEHENFELVLEKDLAERIEGANSKEGSGRKHTGLFLNRRSKVWNRVRKGNKNKTGTKEHETTNDGDCDDKDEAINPEEESEQPQAVPFGGDSTVGAEDSVHNDGPTRPEEAAYEEEGEELPIDEYNDKIIQEQDLSQPTSKKGSRKMLGWAKSLSTRGGKLLKKKKKVSFSSDTILPSPEIEDKNALQDLDISAVAEVNEDEERVEERNAHEDQDNNEEQKESEVVLPDSVVQESDLKINKEVAEALDNSPAPPVVENGRSRTWARNSSKVDEKREDPNYINTNEGEGKQLSKQNSFPANVPLSFGTSSASASRTEEDKHVEEEETEQEVKKVDKPQWKEALDHSTGRYYYYNRLTRTTTWTKPDTFDDEQNAYKKYKKDKKQRKNQSRKIDESSSNNADGQGEVTPVESTYLRKKDSRDFNPTVWHTKQEIISLLYKMPPLQAPQTADQLLEDWKGHEEELLKKLRIMKDDIPFDEIDPIYIEPPIGNRSAEEEKKESDDVVTNIIPISSYNRGATYSAYSTTRAPSNASTSIMANRMRSNRTALTNQTPMTETTEKIQNIHRNTTLNTLRGETVNVPNNGSTASVSTYADEPEGSTENKSDSTPTSVRRERELRVEEFASNRYGLQPEIFEKKDGTPPRPEKKNLGPTARDSPLFKGLNEGNSYAGDNDDSTYGASTVSGLSHSDNEFSIQKQRFDRERRIALDDAIKNNDWELAASVAIEIRRDRTPEKNESLLGPNRRYNESKRPIGSPTEWTQSDIDRFITDNDWDTVAEYISRMRDESISKKKMEERGPVMEAKDYYGSRRESPSTIDELMETKGEDEKLTIQGPRKRFGAQSQLQHEELLSVATSNEESVYRSSSDGSYYSSSSGEDETSNDYSSMQSTNISSLQNSSIRHRRRR